MRREQPFWTGLSNVVQHRVMRTANMQASDYTRFVFHRRLICVMFILVGLIGSPGIASAGPVIVETVDTGGGAGVVLTTNQRVAARLFDEVFSQQKPDVCVLLMAANAINHTPGGDVEGPAGFEQYAAEVWTAYPEATFVIDDGVTDGDLVTLRWSIGGEQAAPLEGLAILRFEQNMIAESWIQYDGVEQAEVTPAVPEICPPCREP
ncbi:MAG: ester cyclase [Chloroflexia bacterium]|nr:ester cyclase [Chloroflexia bacterium]